MARTRACEKGDRCNEAEIVLTEGVPEKADELNVRDVPTVMEPELVTVKDGLAERRHIKRKDGVSYRVVLVC